MRLSEYSFSTNRSRLTKSSATIFQQLLFNWTEPLRFFKRVIFKQQTKTQGEHWNVCGRDTSRTDSRSVLLVWLTRFRVATWALRMPMKRPKCSPRHLKHGNLPKASPRMTLLNFTYQKLQKKLIAWKAPSNLELFLPPRLMIDAGFAV